MATQADAFEEYIRDISRALEKGDATEHTHRPALKRLLETLGKGITATNEPKRILCGAPDFIIARKTIPLGHVETKDVGVNLDEIERGRGPNGEQFVRYRDGLPNWILTDYLEFRWFVGGQKRLTVRLAEVGAQGKLKLTPDGKVQLAELLDAFFKQEALTVGTAKDLAYRMAGMTRIIRDLIINTFTHETEKGWLHNWLDAFREVLIPDLDEKQFADIFAQTLAYGLFAARVHAPPNKEFSREMAAFSLPKTNPFLRKLFSEIAGVDMPETIDWSVADVVELLKHADIPEILKDFGKGKGKQDPVVHFYETFLSRYDPKLRESRGVYYTPEPVVSYIVRSIDHLVKSQFNRPKGLADENTLILDPALGTGTFLYFVIQQIHETFGKQEGAWDSYINLYLLNRIFGFEILMAPYAVAHLKLAMLLQQTGYTFGSDKRLGIYLTNTLEEAAKKSDKLFANWIADEANAAFAVKKDLPIMVVLGNPPYSIASQNRSEYVIFVNEEQKWVGKGKKRRLVTIKYAEPRRKTVKTFIGTLLLDYKKGLEEKKVNLDDDFIKFIRFGQWRIERTGYGILGFITNNTYLDGLTHRRMRQSLMEMFTDIYILDLHGSTKRKETAPGGSKDENVFDIQQGVAIGIFVKKPGENGLAKVHHADLWGLRTNKYARLLESHMGSTEWTDIEPTAKNFFFIPRRLDEEEEYQKYTRITDAFSLWSSGIQSKRDKVAVAQTKAELISILENFATMDAEALRVKYGLPPDGRDWRIHWASQHAVEIIRKGIAPSRLLYRPFDTRWTVVDNRSKGFVAYPRFEVMCHMRSDNLGLILTRQISLATFQHAWVTRYPIDGNTISLQTREYNYLFPLYVYPFAREMENSPVLHVEVSQRPAGTDGRVPNLNLKLMAEVEHLMGLTFVSDGAGDLKKTFGPEDFFHYLYAVFQSPTYRRRYAEFLKRDFPRLPLTRDRDLFAALAEKGARLVALHLMASPKFNELITEFPEKGDGIVERVTFAERECRIWINSKQYFGGVPNNVWQFHIGGYQVCKKWLKDRKGQTLTFDDIEHYQKVIVALNETISLMDEVDSAIPSWPIT